MTYSDGGVFATTTAKAKIPLSNVGREFSGEKFTLFLLNRGADIITVFRTPLLKNEVKIEVPTTSPGVVLNDMSWEEFFNGLYAQANAGTQNLLVNLFSVPITASEARVESAIVEAFPRDTYLYPEAK